MKNNRLNLFIFIVGFATVMMFSCSKTDELSENEMGTGISVSEVLPSLTKSEVIALAVQKKGTYAISESEALGLLERFTASDGIESAVNVKSSVLKKNAKTGKDMYYEFVFESDKGNGFSIISADERVPELLCYSEVGSISDTSFNKSMKFCFELMDIYVEEQTKEELDIEALALSAKEKQDLLFKMKNQSTLKRGIDPPVFDPNDPKPDKPEAKARMLTFAVWNNLSINTVNSSVLVYPVTTG